MKVSELLPADRLVSRLRDLGAHALSTVELLTIIVGGGSMEPAQQIITEAHGSLRRIALQPVATLTRHLGVGAGKAATVHAALELGKRLCAEGRDEATPIRSPRDVVAVFSPRMEDLPVEEFHVAILDAQHRLERDITITRGILNSSLVHPREVFREAIAERAAAIILVHNHPSGDPAPSIDDKTITEQLVAAGRLLDIPVHDHVIIGRGRYTSFAEAGLL